MPRSAKPKNKASASPKRNQARWSPEAREAQKRRASERAAASLLEPLPEATAPFGIRPIGPTNTLASTAGRSSKPAGTAGRCPRALPSATSNSSLPNPYPTQKSRRLVEAAAFIV